MFELDFFFLLSFFLLLWIVEHLYITIWKTYSFCYLSSTFMAKGDSSTSATWDGYSQYLNADGLHVVSPVRRLNLFSMLYLEFILILPFVIFFSLF